VLKTSADYVIFQWTDVTTTTVARTLSAFPTLCGDFHASANLVTMVIMGETAKVSSIHDDAVNASCLNLQMSWTCAVFLRRVKKPKRFLKFLQRSLKVANNLAVLPPPKYTKKLIYDKPGIYIK